MNRPGLRAFTRDIIPPVLLHFGAVGTIDSPIF
jgi:hypothetical protein